MSNHYSDLEVDPHVRYSSPPSSMAQHNGWPRHVHAHSDKISSSQEQSLPVSETVPPRRRRMVCGLRPRTFWLVAAIVAVIVIAAAVGGGVGGSLASKKSSSSDQTTSQTATPTDTTQIPSTASDLVTSPASSLATATSTISVSTSTTIGPSQTLLVDCPSSNNTLYVPSQSSQIFRKVCSRSFLSNGFDLVGEQTQSLDHCIDLCAAYNTANASQIASGAASICNAVCWRATIEGDDYPGRCFGFLTTNSSGAFAYNDDSRCNGAALINQAFT